MLTPNPSPHSDPEVLTRFQEELARTTALPDLAAAGPALWPRFAGYYEGLARLPRKARRALQRRWRRSLGGLALLCALGQTPALAAIINVGGACTLVDAITAANSDAPAGGCTPGSAVDTLVLSAGSSHMLTAVNNSNPPYGPTGLPLATSAITIAGNGSTITRDPSAPLFRILAVAADGDLTLQETTVSGGMSPDFGGGIAINAGGALTLTNSTVSDNSAGGNARGGGVYNSGTLTFTSSTVSGNNMGSRSTGGGMSNGGTATLVQTLVSGNSASAQGSEVVNGGAVNANNFNLFGHGSRAGVDGFTPGPTDLVPTAPLAAILSPTLADNGGPTRTLALVAVSPAVDAVPAGNCGTTTDQRGAPRPRDGDGNTVADCDIGAFEGTQPAEAVAPGQNPQARCTASRCNIRIQCNLDPASGAQCTNRIDIFVSRSAARLSEPASTKAPRRIRFAFGVINLPPGETRNVRLRPTRQGRRIVRTSTRRSLRGVLEIRNSPGTVTSTRIRIRLR